MTLRARDDNPEDTTHLLVYQQGGPRWLTKQLLAVPSRASFLTGEELPFHKQQSIQPDSMLPLSVDQLVPTHTNVNWHSAPLDAKWLSPTGYYLISEDWGHTSSKASGGGSCRHTTGPAGAADLTRMWAVAISSTTPDGEKVAASLLLQYGRQQPWVHGGPGSHTRYPSTGGPQKDHGTPRRGGKGSEPAAPTIDSGCAKKTTVKCGRER